MVVGQCAHRRAREDLGGPAHRLDPSAGDQNGAVLDQRVGGRATRRRIVAKREDAPANDARVRAQPRMSLRRSAAIRSISASAVLVSASAALARRRWKAARMSGLLLPLIAMMKGKPKRAR